PANAWSNHGAVVMPNGLVLIVGGGVAEIFDPTKNAFRKTTAPGASREGATAHLLASGKGFVPGGDTLAAEVFDPTTETWSYPGASSDQPRAHVWTPTPAARLVAAGGHFATEGVDAAKTIFDPLAHPTGAFLDIGTTAHGSQLNAAALAG